MKTIQMTIDESLLDQVDKVVHELGANRSAFIRDALQAALRQYAIQQMEERHATGYTRQPAAVGEFSNWENEQVWSEP